MPPTYHQTDMNFLTVSKFCGQLTFWFPFSLILLVSPLSVKSPSSTWCTCSYVDISVHSSHNICRTILEDVICITKGLSPVLSSWEAEYMWIHCSTLSQSFSFVHNVKLLLHYGNLPLSLGNNPENLLVISLQEIYIFIWSIGKLLRVKEKYSQNNHKVPQIITVTTIKTTCLHPLFATFKPHLWYAQTFSDQGNDVQLFVTDEQPSKTSPDTSLVIHNMLDSNSCTGLKLFSLYSKRKDLQV